MRSIAILVFALLVLFPSRPEGLQAGTPAARVGDVQTCPLVTNLVPHNGGPILTGANTVLICGLPAGTVTSQCSCVGPPSTIVGGSGTVLIEGKPAARLGSGTNHGGSVVQGCPTVLIGG